MTDGGREIEAQDPEWLLAQGEHLGYPWVVAHNGRGCRCGYVRLPAGHPWAALPREDVTAEVHGGITFACSAGDGGGWIGFDCEHAHDRRDPALPMPEIFRLMDADIGRMLDRLEDGERWRVRTQEYVEDQCRRLCEQAAAAAGGG